MINHTRTLLVNLPDDGVVANCYDAYVEPGFRRVRPAAAVAAAHAAVLPSASPEVRKMQAFLYLQLMHRPDFLPFLVMFDSRVTYTVDDAGMFEEARTGVRAGLRAGLLDCTRALGLLENTFVAGYAEMMAPGIEGTYDLVDGLRRTWASRLDGPTRLAAGLYLLVHRLEEARRHGQS